MNETTKKLLTVAEFAAALNMTQSGVRRWILERRIATVHLGRLCRIPAGEIDRLVSAGYCPPKARGQQ
jgi:excisionase family DNA binding protein